MRGFILSMTLSTALFSTAVAAPDAHPETIRGRVTVVSVGGVETHSRQALQIGDRRFEIAGDAKDVSNLFSCEGKDVEVLGTITNLFYIGGEGYPLLTVVSVRVTGDTKDACLILGRDLEKILAEPGNERLIIAVLPAREGGRITEHSRAALDAFLAQLAADGEPVEVLKTKAGSQEMMIRTSKKAVQALIDRGSLSSIRLIAAH